MFFGLHFICLCLLSDDGDGGSKWMVFAVKMSKQSDKHLYESQEVEIPLDNTQVTSYWVIQRQREAFFVIQP